MYYNKKIGGIKRPDVQFTDRPVWTPRDFMVAPKITRSHLPSSTDQRDMNYRLATDSQDNARKDAFNAQRGENLFKQHQLELEGISQNVAGRDWQKNTQSQYNVDRDNAVLNARLDNTLNTASTYYDTINRKKSENAMIDSETAAGLIRAEKVDEGLKLLKGKKRLSELLSKS